MESASRESRRTLFFNYIHVMNKRFSLIIILGICLIVTSCSNKPKTREERVKEFRNELTTQDTTVMLKLCDNAMELLKGKQIDQVLASLYEYNDSTKEVKPNPLKLAICSILLRWMVIGNFVSKRFRMKLTCQTDNRDPYNK